MSIATQMWLAGLFTWFLLRTADHFWPPHTPVLNAMLTLIVVLVTFARWLEQRLAADRAR